MTIRHARSTDGLDADDGSTWALAKASLSGALSASAPGDTVYLSQSHAEAPEAEMNLVFSNNSANPVIVVGGNDGASPPTALATAAVATTGGAHMNTYGAAFVRGVNFTCGTPGGSYANLGLNITWSCPQTYDTCDFIHASTHPSANIAMGAGSSGSALKTSLINCRVKTSNANPITLGNSIVIRGGSMISGSTTPGALFTPGATGANVVIDGFDFSALASTLVLFNTSQAARIYAVVKNCKLPASWSGRPLASADNIWPATRIEMLNCDSGATNYRVWIEDYAGSVKSEATVVRTSGANNGATSLSVKLESSANAKFPSVVLESSDMSVWNDAVGAAKTVTVEIAHAAQGSGTAGAFRNDEIWLEVTYPSSVATPVVGVQSSRMTLLSTPTDHATSTEVWTGITTPTRQKLTATFTPQMAGWLTARVVLAKATKVCYVCHKIAVA